MYSKLRFLLFLSLIIGLVFSCSQALYVPTVADSEKSGVSNETLVLGRKLYVKNCAGCHNLYLPERFTKEEWEKLMPEMQKKAKCTNEEATIITKYLVVRSKKPEKSL